MNNLQKTLALLIAGVLMMSSLTACITVQLPDDSLNSISEKDTDNTNNNAADSDPSDRLHHSDGSTATDPTAITTAPAATAYPSVTTARPITPITTSEPIVTSTSPIITTKPITTAPIEPAYPAFDNLGELQDYLDACRKAGDLDVVFEYGGDSQELYDANFADMLCLFYYNLSRYDGKSNLWLIEMIDYPGDRMVQAYRSGDRSELSDDEERTLEIALAAVEDAQTKSNSAIELEILLHDWLCERVSYANQQLPGVSDPNDPPRHLTAVGAILDGSAICQGYVDAFYLLGTLAGFEVDRQAGYSNGVSHMFNSIRLDGAWYIVDVTHNDEAIRVNGDVISDYHLFNAGRDRCAHTWEETHELRPISAVSSDAYYYNLPADNSEHGYEKTFDTLEEMAIAIAEQYAYYGRGEHYVMLASQASNSAALKEYLTPALDRLDVAYSYTIWASVAGDHTYYLVRFTPT